MSVATHSPLLGSKRLFGEASSNVVEHRNNLDDPWGAAAAAAAAATAAGCAQQHHHQHQAYKRARRCSAVSESPVGERCAPFGSLSGASALRYLSGIYPRMDQKVISNVLDECGGNIEAAIKRLEDLQLLEDSQCTNEEAAAEASAAAAVAAAATAEQPPIDQVSPPTGAAAAEAPPTARSAAEWVQVVVSEMSSATDMDDAQARAARVLQSFEAQVQSAERQAASKELAALHAQVAELARGNTILKKAVQIQNTRMQDLADKEAQLAALQQALAQQQEKIRVLELSNYSLNMHLRQAASNPMPQHRHPDVF
mmetsp:Transcript_34111/g.96671  ORF Transcript_34111/g.96671 Transcript_34111/m.96671 type:complete len:312 (-) Transcript_34111:132-1067(-)|eukprot:CAMPEP_0117657504 /NCGR_PEP_ID=MMETSP0804-20121206/5366_1 /TAXON_ID=1074897 /ORGANISM="Tetraselmis astigmatica, Strain CCMP880" /LENGTH=311 /DNA_ID=CAMNT_0005463963 /DNA_START=457 /DNA_END=1392 /DNA_ORIENTATION=+